MLLSIVQCTQRPTITPYKFELKADWPTPIVPKNNPLTLESIALGKALFYDSYLSIDSSTSCASCHFPQHGFADAASLSSGVKNRKGFRNSGTLTNVAFLPYFNRDGGVKTLDIFASVPLEDHDEMGFNLLLVGERLNKNTKYNQAAKDIYNRELDGFVITRSIASFLRTFISDNSPYDKNLEDHISFPLSPSERRGKDLFFSNQAKCSQCHSGINFTDYSFQNNGLFKRYLDRGRERITLNPDDEGKFRVATLRNIELTAPYMHNGSLPDLESVLQHYSSHGTDHQNKNPILDQITLNNEEQSDIIAFLKTLTDTEFINNQKLLPSKK